ncbi:MAG: hypothetical protein KF774_05800 [Planctomyces sp.]|nr:hypothetical protein [Planctomyces sp.]
MTGCSVLRQLSRCGATTLDYVLLMTALLPFVALSLSPIRRIISLVYELTCVLIASPFL